MTDRDSGRILACGCKRLAHVGPAEGPAALCQEVVPVRPVLQFLARTCAGENSTIGADYVDKTDMAIAWHALSQQCVALWWRNFGALRRLSAADHRLQREIDLF